MKNLAVILACGARKRNYPCDAIDMYIGHYYLALKNAALLLAQLEDIFILSAKYGLIKSTEVINPYEQKLNGLNAITKNKIDEQKILLNDYLDIIVLGGKAYHQLLGVGRRIFFGGMFSQIKQARNFKP